MYCQRLLHLPRINGYMIRLPYSFEKIFDGNFEAIENAPKCHFGHFTLAYNDDSGRYATINGSALVGNMRPSP